jgi:hypothetical protein
VLIFRSIYSTVVDVFLDIEQKICDGVSYTTHSIFFAGHRLSH